MGNYLQLCKARTALSDSVIRSVKSAETKSRIKSKSDKYSQNWIN